MDRTPCACPLQTGTVELMDACGARWPEAHYSAVLMARLSLAAHELAGLESVRVPFDITVEASAFGAGSGKERIDAQPSIVKHPVASLEDLEKDVPGPEEAKRSSAVLGSVRMLSRKLPDTPVIAAIVAPFSLAGQLLGYQEAIMNVRRDPELLTATLEKALEWDTTYALAAMEAGADAIVLIDASASGDVIGPADYERFALPYQSSLVDVIRKGGVQSILHICGRTTGNMSLMARSGVDGISVDQQMDMQWVCTELQGRAAVIGNVSPTSTLLFGSPADVSGESMSCIAAGTDVLAPGCGFAPRTPLANMQAMTRAASKLR